MTLCCTLLLLQGGPPLLTDDPGTPGDGRWEINAAFTLEKSADQRLFEAPLLDVNRGVGERVQLKLEIPWVVLDEGGSTRSGLGNTLLGVKWRFLDEDEAGLAVSAYPQVEFENPTSSAERGLAEPGTEWILPFQVQRSFGFLDANGELGYGVRDVGEDEWIYGLALGKELAERFECLGEIHGTAEPGFEESRTLVGLGFRWDLSAASTLLVSASRTIAEPSGEDPETLGYVGLQLRF